VHQEDKLVEERAYYVAWSQVERVGPVLLRRLQQHFGTLADAWKASATQLQAVEGFGYQLAGAVTAARSQINPEQLLEQHSAKNPYFWTLADADYPRLLLEIPSPPPVLYYRGIVQPKENQGITPMVGIVGTREPSEYGNAGLVKSAQLLPSMASRWFPVWQRGLMQKLISAVWQWVDER
jgi:DNA processing protein